MRAPRLLRNDPSVAPMLRADLERAVMAHEPYDVARGEARLLAAIGVATAAGAGGHSAAEAQADAGAFATKSAEGLWSGAGAKLAVAGVTAGVIAASLFVLNRDPAPRAAHPRPAAAPAQVDSPAPALEPPAPAPATPHAPEAARAPAPVVGRDAPAAARLPADADAELRRETAQLGVIKQLIDRHPARAYALAQAGHRKFPRGMLREEREALAIIALWNSGDEAAARRRGEAFLARYPNSAMRGQVEQRLAHARAGDATAP